jgi:hypothetical protein
MRFLIGLNAGYYKLAGGFNPYYLYDPYVSTITAVWNPSEPTGNIDQTLGSSYLGWIGVRRDLTLTTGPPSYGPVTRKTKVFYTVGPWTTGMVRVYHAGSVYSGPSTATGYDNRTASGLNGVLSLVRPRLVNKYVTLPAGSIQSFRSSASIGNMKIEFLPEPRAVLSLVGGMALLTSLRRFRRR